MRGACLLLLLAAAGCLGPPSPGGAHVSLVNAPRLDAVLPNETALPDFHVGWQQEHATVSPGAVDGLSRVYDYRHNNATVRHSLAMTVMRFGSYEDAKAAVAERVSMRPAYPVNPPWVDFAPAGEGLYAQNTTFGDPGRPEGFGQNVAVIGVRGLYVVWASESSQGEPSAADAIGLVRDSLARVPAGP